MKKTMKHILALVIVLPFLFAGCQKSEVMQADKTTDTGNYKDMPVLCGDPYITNLVDFGETFTAGTFTIGNDENNLFALFEAAPGYELRSTALYVGPESGIPGDWIDPTTHTGRFYPEMFNYETTHDPAVMEYMITHDLSLLDDCFAVVAVAKVKLPGGGIDIVSAKSNMKTLAFYFDYCKQECETPPPFTGCETAYAYGEDLATCFIDIPGVNSNNWGWSNGPLDEGTYSWPIYAGAGQCDITKGTLVGNLDVVYSGGICTVTYNVYSNITLDETHLYVGNDILAKKKNKYTTAPGQFPYSGGDTFTIDGLSGEIYVVAHSGVCGD